MGRAHRHSHDYGAVVVLDSRLDSEVSELFPPWIYREFTEYSQLKKLCSELHHFYAQINAYQKVGLSNHDEEDDILM